MGHAHHDTTTTAHTAHRNAGKDTRILLTGVFGPFAQNDEYGSRAENPMELYHNQVTRVQGPFSLRMFHRTFGLLMIEANIEAACTVLEFPTLDRFVEELRDNAYDIVGISAIIPNMLKVKKMCAEIRRLQPGATIVVGGHIANREDLEEIIDADHICRGDGIRWFREFLGQDASAPVKHPAVISGFGTRIMGISIPGTRTAAVLIPSVGCPMGCNFCSTSALFGGKGNSVVFYKTGDELFAVLCQLEQELGVGSFFVLDENFLLYRERALRLLELMQRHDKSWAFYVFTSARVLESYTMEQLVGLGVSWVWMGIEGRDSRYSKLNGVDTLELVKRFQANGIRVLGSTIIGLEEHTPENIREAIAHAVAHDTDFHQFMLYTPLPGTPLYHEHRAAGTLLTEDECPAADAHGQTRFNFRHPHIRDGREGEHLIDAFTDDLNTNGPSLARIARTTLQGWQAHKNHPDPRVVRRYKAGARGLASIYAGSVWAMRHWYRGNRPLVARLTGLLRDLYAEFGLPARIMAPAVGLFVLVNLFREDRRLRSGWTYEPPAIYEKNARAIALESAHPAPAKRRTAGIPHPVYDLAWIGQRCREQLEAFQAGLGEQLETAMRELAAIQEQYFREVDSASPCAAKDEHFSRIRERALAGIAQVRERMHDLSDSAQERITHYRSSMTETYRRARHHVDQACDAMHANAELVKLQAQQACARLEREISSVG